MEIYYITGHHLVIELVLFLIDKFMNISYVKQNKVISFFGNKNYQN